MSGLHAIIDDNLMHVEPAIQAAAGACLHDYLAGYGNPKEHGTYLSAYCDGLFDNDSPYVRAGSGIALAALPKLVLQPVWQQTLPQVGRACVVESVPHKRDADARVKAIEVQSCICLCWLCYRTAEACMGVCPP